MIEFEKFTVNVCAVSWCSVVLILVLKKQNSLRTRNLLTTYCYYGNKCTNEQILSPVDTSNVRLSKMLSNLFSHFADERHLVKWQLIFSRRALHDRGQERLRVEEAGEPDRCGQAEVGGPRFELLDPEQEIGVPV